MQVSPSSHAHAVQAGNNGHSPAKAARDLATPGQTDQPFGQIVSAFARGLDPTLQSNSAPADNTVVPDPSNTTTLTESAVPTGLDMSTASGDTGAPANSTGAATDLIA